MEALNLLRRQLEKDYPDDKPVFRKSITAPEDVKFFFDEIVLPAFENIEKEFHTFHFHVSIKKFAFVSKIDIKDGCSYFSFSIKISRKYAFAALIVTYRDHSICPYNFEDKILLEERFDLSKIHQELPEELVIKIFSDTFLNRKTYLQKITERQRNDAQEKEELIREERRAKLIKLKRENNNFDPQDEFQKYLDSPEYARMRDFWIDYNLPPILFPDESGNDD